MRPHILAILFLFPLAVLSQSRNTIAVKDLDFTLNDKPFNYTGISFFNAIYNPAFNESDASRRTWLEKLKANGINVVRTWGQWDNKRGFIDTCPTCTLYEHDGRLRPVHLNTLKKIIEAADALDMAVLFVLFQRESWNDNIRGPRAENL